MKEIINKAIWHFRDLSYNKFKTTNTMVDLTSNCCCFFTVNLFSDIWQKTIVSRARKRRVRAEICAWERLKHYYIHFIDRCHRLLLYKRSALKIFPLFFAPKFHMCSRHPIYIYEIAKDILFCSFLY